MTKRKAAISLLAAVHLAVTFWHGRAHQVLAVTLAPEKKAFVFIVIIVTPLVGASLVWTRRADIGAWIFLLSMLGSFLFGVYHHFLVVSEDHVRHLPAGSADVQSAFIVSAAALAVLELVSTVYAAFCLARPGRKRSG